MFTIESKAHRAAFIDDLITFGIYARENSPGVGFTNVEARCDVGCVPAIICASAVSDSIVLLESDKRGKFHVKHEIGLFETRAENVAAFSTLCKIALDNKK